MIDGMMLKQKKNKKKTIMKKMMNMIVIKTRYLVLLNIHLLKHKQKKMKNSRNGCLIPKTAVCNYFCNKNTSYYWFFSLL
jgi:hypothetical protein